MKGEALETGAKEAFEKKFGREPTDQEVTDFIEAYGPQKQLEEATVKKFESLYEEKNGEKPNDEQLQDLMKEIEGKNQDKPAELTDEVKQEIQASKTWFSDHEQEVLDVEKLEKDDAIATFKSKNGYEPSTAELNKFMAELGPNVLDREVQEAEIPDEML